MSIARRLAFGAALGALPLVLALGAPAADAAGSPGSVGAGIQTIGADRRSPEVGCPTTVVGRVGVPMNDACTVYTDKGGVWLVAYGSFPAGLSLDPVTGRITGTPTRAGLSQAGLTFVTDLRGYTLPVNFSITESVAGRY